MNGGLPLLPKRMGVWTRHPQKINIIVDYFTMTPFEAQIADQERIEQQDRIRINRWMDGETDAAFAFLPQYMDEDYLAGYLQGIKALKHDDNGKILYYTPEPDIEEFSVPLPADPD